ncbi:hypothetical protein [Xanthomonas sp. 3498]|uniref:hypothetical protein n=1 Tax=Xanthomonas sp. 3498 TaxID=2663863 RepID=UPI00161235E0|nr:hypothetical protein [Xanthomonas sp. 3498]MBB5875656.1 hypothetical protein [Xanthomonas sp. 3498]
MSTITLRNETEYVAQFVVKKGQRVVARIPGIQPKASIQVPTDDAYEVTATAIIDGNTYISAPLDASGPTGFLAQVLLSHSEGTYEFNVAKVASRNPSQLQFQKTCLSPVTFTITRNGQPLQRVVVYDSFNLESLDISDTFHIHAVINGVATDTLTTTNPTPTVTAITETCDLGRGYVMLELS